MWPVWCINSSWEKKLVCDSSAMKKGGSWHRGEIPIQEWILQVSQIPQLQVLETRSHLLWTTSTYTPRPQTMVSTIPCYSGSDFGHSLFSIIFIKAPWSNSSSLSYILLGQHGFCLLGNMLDILKADTSVRFRKPGIYSTSLETKPPVKMGPSFLDELLWDSG